MNAALIALLISVAGQTETARAPVPAPAAQKDAEKQIRDLFKDDYAKKTPADLQILARKLLGQATDETIEIPARFVMLRDARDLAAQAGDVDTAFKAVEATAGIFDVDPLALKSAALAKSAALLKVPDVALAVARGYLKLMGECASVAQFEVGAALTPKAETAAKAAGDAALTAQVLSLGRDLVTLQKENAALKSHRKTLEEKPADPAANLAVGKFTCLTMGKWAQGLPMLVLGSDAGLKAAAEKELALPDQSPEQAALGDAWWALAEKERSAEPRKRMQLRAAYWYERALGGVTGLVRAGIEQKLKASGLLVFPANAERKKTDLVGGTGGGPFEDLGASPSLLIGLRVTIVGQPSFTKSVQAILLTDGARAEGKVYGDPVPPVKEVVAKPGYAVAGLISCGTDGTARMRGFKLVFMRIAGTSLDPRDTYTSDWIGDRGAGAEVKLGGDGAYVVGIHGRCASDLDAFGLVVLGR